MIEALVSIAWLLIFLGIIALASALVSSYILRHDEDRDDS